jgi:aerobic carbon-monoxide dehydrogenase medium subunit
MEVSIPASGMDARRVFGQAAETTVVSGGTIVMPALRSGRLAPKHVMLLTHAGLDRVERERDHLCIGAAARLADLAEVPEPLAGAVRGVADPEVRAQATIGGNLCAHPSAAVSRGDLQGPLIAMDAKVRWTDGTDEWLDGVEQFLRRSPDRRLVLGLEMPVPEHGAFAALRRPHSHGYTPVSVSVAVVGGELRLAATGLAAHGIRLRSPEDPTPTDGDQLEPPDDALASGWYRRQMLPVLVRRCLDQIGSAPIEGRQ